VPILAAAPTWRVRCSAEGKLPFIAELGTENSVSDTSKKG
jgi:hypothetical protein